MALTGWSAALLKKPCQLQQPQTGPGYVRLRKSTRPRQCHLHGHHEGCYRTQVQLDEILLHTDVLVEYAKHKCGHILQADVLCVP